MVERQGFKWAEWRLGASGQTEEKEGKAMGGVWKRRVFGRVSRLVAWSVVVGGLVVAGCRKELERLKKVKWTPEIGAPLAWTDLYPDDAIRVVGNANYYYDSTNTIVLVYTSDVTVLLPGGGSTKPFSDTLFVRFFNNYESGSVYFQAARLTVRYTNTTNDSVYILVNNVEGISKQGNVVALNGGNIGQWQVVPPNGTLVEIYDQNNSNLPAFLQNAPVRLYIQAASQSTVAGALQVHAELELPFYGYADSLFLIDTVQFDPVDVKPYHDMTLIITATNYFPVRMGFQMILYDSAMAPLDTLIRAIGWVPPAGTDGSPGMARRELYLDPERLPVLQRARWAVFRAFFHSRGADQGSPIRVTADQHLYLVVAVRVRVEVSG